MDVSRLNAVAWVFGIGDSAVVIADEGQAHELTEAYADLLKLGELPTNWDGAGSDAPTGHALATAQRLLAWVVRQPLGRMPFAVAPLPGAGVLLDWRCRAADLEVDIGPAGQLGFLLIEKSNGERRFEEQDNVPEARIHELLLRAFTGR